MSKILKIIGQFMAVLLEWSLAILIVFSFAVRTTYFQTYLASLATDFLSKELKTQLKIERVDLYFFDRVQLNGVFIRDLQKDTLANLGSLNVVLNPLSLSTNKINIKSIKIKDGDIGIHRSKKNGDYNYWFITDYFESSSSSSNSTEAPIIHIERLLLDRVNFNYHDNRKGYLTFGMDYDHIVCKNIQMRVHDVITNGYDFKFDIRHLSTIERSGFHLTKFKTSGSIVDKGLYLKKLIVKTPYSQIYAEKLNFCMSQLEDFYTFEDSVTFDATLNASTVNLKDLSYFATALEGMNQNVYLEADVSRKVNNLKIDNLDLRYGKNSILKGNLILPNFNAPEKSYLEEIIHYAYVDLNDIKKLKLPVPYDKKPIELDEYLNRFSFFELKETGLSGYSNGFQFVAENIHTALGNINLSNGLYFTALNDDSYRFEPLLANQKSFYVDSFLIGKLIDDPLFGGVSGKLETRGIIGGENDIRLEDINGQLSDFEFNNYSYSNIDIKDGRFINYVVDGLVTINDPNAQIQYDGKVDLNNGLFFDFNVNTENLKLKTLNFGTADDEELSTQFDISMGGKDFDSYEGHIDLLGFNYTKNNKKLAIPQVQLQLHRDELEDELTLVSPIIELQAAGKASINTLQYAILNTLSKSLSALIPSPELRKTKSTASNHLKGWLKLKKTKELIQLFLPNEPLIVANGTTLNFEYNEENQLLELDLFSQLLKYDNYAINQLKVNHVQQQNNVQTLVQTSDFSLSDSISVSDFIVDIKGASNTLNTSVSWDSDKEDSSRITWNTNILNPEQFDFLLKPSYFSLNGSFWEIMNSSKMSYGDDVITIDHLVLERNEQFIALNGIVSDRPEDVLNVSLNQIQLNDFSHLVGSGINLEGILNGTIAVKTPFSSLRIQGKLGVQELVVNKESVGDINLNGYWDNEKEGINLSGDLAYLKNETFDFAGYFYPNRSFNQLDFNLDFKQMDLQFANAFMDPEVLSDIKGKLTGNLKLKGNLEKPLIDGKLFLNGALKVSLLGTKYNLTGPISFNGAEQSFTMDNLPIRDEEGNFAYLTGTINHTNFTNWNLDLGFNIEYVPNQYNAFGKPKPIDRFIVLNTTFNEEDIYYGKAYATGYANLFITEENTEISVNLKSEKGTKIDLPMYGNSELEEVDFIQFGKEITLEDTKVDFTGVDLDLNLNITPEAKIALIFNEKTGDEIKATGRGNLNIKSNNLGDLFMNGRYVIDEGKYNFVLGLIKQEFFIEPGGSITWVEDPYNAILDVKTYNTVQANLNEIATDIVDEGRSSGTGNQPIKCLLALSQSIEEPIITLDVQAPQANETGKALINRIRSDKDELQRQFFSLLILKKFAPLAGSTTANGGVGGGVYDVIEQQINDFIDGFGAKSLKMNVAYDNDATLLGNKQSVEVGLSTALGENERILIKGSFGVANTTNGSSAEAQSKNNVIGDMSIEYLINEDGSFRVNLFNESNNNKVIQNNNSPFTQGVGIHYQEDFNSGKDFKLAQFFKRLIHLDLNVRRKRKRKAIPLYPQGKQPTKKRKNELIGQVYFPEMNKISSFVKNEKWTTNS